MTTHEAVLSAVLAVVEGVSPLGQAAPAVTRNEPQPLSLGAGGWVALQDGEAGEPEELLSPLTYDWEREAELHLLVPAISPAAGRAHLAALVAALEAAIAAAAESDGALAAAGVDWAELGPPAYDALPIEGEDDGASAVCTLRLAYTTATAAV